MWFATGTASAVGFNAIKRNGLWVYPTGCQQYVSGAWVSKTGKTYNSGAWRGMGTYLYNAGDQCAEITGGWAAISEQQSSASHWGYTANGTSADISFNADSIYILGQTTINDRLTSPAVRTLNPVDLTGYNTLKINCSAHTRDLLFGAYLPNQTIYPIYNSLAHGVVPSDAVSGILDVTAVNQKATIIIGVVAYKEGGTDRVDANILSLKMER